MNFDFLKKFSDVKLLVAGEVGIDEYVWGDTRRISPEAPVPVIEVDSVSYKLGLAANVAQNIISLGSNAKLVSVRGEDRDGDTLEQMLRDSGIRESRFVSDPSRPTLRKVRLIAQKQHVARVDYERVHPLDAKQAKTYSEAICDSIPQCDGVILQDYGKGLWNADTVNFIRVAKAHKKPVFVDPSRLTPPSLYQGVTLLTPNAQEAEAMCGASSRSTRALGKDDEKLLQFGKSILATTHAEHVIITCGEWGMISVSQSNTQLNRIPTFAREVYDVTGAGDTVVSVLAIMYVLGYSLPFAMRIANAAAGIVVGKIGAACVTPDDLRAELERLEGSGLLKI